MPGWRASLRQVTAKTFHTEALSILSVTAVTAVGFLTTNGQTGDKKYQGQVPLHLTVLQAATIM